MKGTILTSKVAREEEHHGENDQKCDVCLQDSCRDEKGKQSKRYIKIKTMIYKIIDGCSENVEEEK